MCYENSGEDHNCVLFDNNDVKCWGNAAQGELGFYGFSPSTLFLTNFLLIIKKGTEDIESIGDFISEMGESLSTVLLLQEVFMVFLSSCLSCSLKYQFFLYYQFSLSSIYLFRSQLHIITIV